MISKTPQVTNAGINLQIRALSGEKITFTRFKIGNGELENDSSEKMLTDLINPLAEFGITSIDTENEGFVKLTGFFDSTIITDDFKWSELGLFAQGEETEEVLYAYANDGENSGYLRASSSGVAIEQTVSMIIAVGEAENVTAKISESMVYASKEEFENHEKATNPHKTTATDVGLGEVPNVPTNEQRPTYTTNAEVEELKSGETLSTAFGKIATSVRNFLSHLEAKNPHDIKATDVGAAASSHTHGASDVNSGVLGVQRGGTGGGTAETARKNLGAAAKATIITAVLSASSWSNDVYSFENSYPSASYDIDVFLRGDTVTTAQKTAFCKAEIVGCYNRNQIKALGAVPVVDIPVVLRVVKK